MRAARKQAARARTTAALLAFLLAAFSLLLSWRRGGSGGLWWSCAMNSAGGSKSLSSGIDPRACSTWQSVTPLADRCMAELGSPATFDCCNGADYACQPCDEQLLGALRCVSPRHMLLRPQPGCGVPLARQPPSPPLLPSPEQQQRSSAAQRGCRLTSEALFGGRWVSANSTPWGGAGPGLPGAFFQPAAAPGSSGTCAPRRPLLSAEVPRCLHGAGFDRVLISGDSTVRHLFTRLVGMVRQQGTVIDGGGMVHGHYSWRAWRGAAAAAKAAAGSTSTSSRGSADSFVTDTLWYSPTANHIQRTWNQTIMQAGLDRLMQLSAPARPAAAAQQPDVIITAGSAGAGSSGSSSIDWGDGADSPAGSADVDDGSTPLVVDFVVGSRAEWQQRFVRQYAGRVLVPGVAERTVVLLSLCVWEGSVVWPEGWLDFLEDVRSRVCQVVVLTCPTDRLRPAYKSRVRQVVAERNRLLRQMVADSMGSSTGGGGGSGDGRSSAGTSSESGGANGSSSSSSSSSGGDGSGSDADSSSSSSSNAGSSGSVSGSNAGSSWVESSARGRPLMLLDLDALTSRVPERATISLEDYHYQCYLSSNTKYQEGALHWAGGDGAQLPRYPDMVYDHMRVPLNGRCGDPVNFAAWQLLLSMLC